MNTAQRHQLVDAAKLLVANNSFVSYGTVRPFPLRTRAQLDAIFTAKDTDSFAPDCSMAITQAYRLVPGLTDPTGFDYKGFGNTATMAAWLKHYSDPSLARDGAICIFGEGLPLGVQHATMVVEPGDDPLLFSHGAKHSSILIPFSEERKFHGGAAPVFLDVGRL